MTIPLDETYTNALYLAITDVWPDHRKYLKNTFSQRSAEVAESVEKIASLIIKLTGKNLNSFCHDYKWTCEKLLEEELHFRRYGTYRLSTLKESMEHVYSRPDFMRPYLNGLLLSQVAWDNHACVFDYYLRNFLPLLPKNTRHLEIGPGHGLFLYFASQHPSVKSSHAWDVSETAIDQTKKALEMLASKPCNLMVADIHSPPQIKNKFNSIVLSEILEHLENPIDALKGLKKFLTYDGKIFINVPVNSPAPDHIFLLKTPKEALDLLKKAGYKIEASKFFPAGGYNLEKALKKKVTISCGIIASLKN